MFTTQKTGGQIGFLPYKKWKLVEQIHKDGIKNIVLGKFTSYLSLLINS